MALKLRATLKIDGCAEPFAKGGMPVCKVVKPNSTASR